MRTSAALLCAGLFTLLSGVLQAELQVFVDPRSIDETETLRLTLRLEGKHQAQTPDLSPLEQDFEVLGKASSSQYRSVNGQVRAWLEYQISLRPKAPGRLIIPSLSLGGQRSKPVTVEVKPLDPSVKQSIEELVFFETEIAPEPVYVQAELRLVRRLFYATTGGVQLYNDLPGAPEVPDAVVLSLGDATSYTTMRNGTDYGVVEQRFAIYPERSGSLTIPAVGLITSVLIQKNGRQRRSSVRVRSEAATVTVLPVPATYPANLPWLPATSVQLHQTLTPGTTLHTGETAELTLTAAVSGNVASAIAPIQLAVPEDRFRRYPQAAETDDRLVGRSLVGTRTQRQSLVPLEPGQTLIPGAELVWWNTAADKLERTRADALALVINGASLASKADPGAALETDNPLPENHDAVPAERSLTVAAPGTGMVVALLLLLTLTVLVWRKRWPTVARTPGFQRRCQRARQQLEVLLEQTDSAPQVDQGKTMATLRRGLIEAVSTSHQITPGEASQLLKSTSAGRAALAILAAQAFGRHEATDATEAAEAAEADEVAANHRLRTLAAFDAVTAAPGLQASADSQLPPLYPTR